MGWTEARMDTLRTMWLAGESAKRISEALGEVTRNAVMGKVHRMGLMGSADHNSRIKGRIFGACRPIMPTSEVDASPETARVEIVDVVPRIPEAVLVPEPIAGSEVAGGTDERSIILRDELVVEAEQDLIVATEDVRTDSEEEEADDEEEVDADDDDLPEESVASEHVDPETLLDEIDEPEIEEDEPAPSARRRRYPSIRRVEPDLPPAPAAPEVVRISGGVIATAKVGGDGGAFPDWKRATSLVSRLTGQDFDLKRPGHRGAVVAVATILAGDPRRILCPRMGEPEVLQMMRRLATGGMIVGGKPTERWRDAVEGDAAFFDDMLTVEEVKDRWRVRIERAPVDATPMQIAA